MMRLITFQPPVFILEKYGEIMDAFVHENFRNQNIGTKLFEEMKKWFEKQDLKRIDVHAAAKNPISNKF